MLKENIFELSHHARHNAASRPVSFEPRREKTCFLGFRPGPSQTGLYDHRRWRIEIILPM